MNAASSAFLRFWAQLSVAVPPYVHPADAPHIRVGDFELALLPIPVNGHLAEADAIVLTLNPGLDDEDRVWEERKDFRDSLLRNLSQSHLDTGYPLSYLNPTFAMHAGAGYWSQSRRLGLRRDPQKLFHVTEAIAQRDNVSIETARAHVSRMVAILQLCPYHSTAKPPQRLLRRLPSCAAARELVTGLIEERRQLVVATRSVADWGFNGPMNGDKLVVYEGNQGTSASLTLNSIGGQAIVRAIRPATAA